MSDGIALRIGPQAAALRRRALRTRIWSSLGTLFLPFVIFPILAAAEVPAVVALIVAILYLVVGIPTYVLLMVRASRDGTRAAHAAGEYLKTAQFARVDSVPKVVVRGPVEALDSWMAVNHVPNPALPGAGSSGLTDSPDSSVGDKFNAKWSGMVVGGSIAMGGVVFALILAGIEVGSLVTGASTGSTPIVLLVLCVCALVVGLSVLFSSARRIASRRAEWYRQNQR